MAAALTSLLFPQKEDRAAAVCVLDGADLELQPLAEQLHGNSLFASRNLIWIKEVDKLKKNTSDFLEKVIPRLSSSHYLLLTAAGLPRNSSLYKIAEKEGVVLEIPEGKPWEVEKQLIEWLTKQAALAGKLLPAQAVQLMVRYAGNDRTLLKNEWQKLICYVGERAEISARDVAAICVDVSVGTPWELGEAIFRRDLHQALRIGRALYTQGQPLLLLIRQLRSQFEVDYQVAKLVADGGSSEQITLEFPYMRGAILTRHIEQSKAYGSQALLKGMLSLDGSEVRLKNSEVEEALLLDLLLINLCTTDDRIDDT